MDKEDWIGNTYRCSFMLRDGECRRKNSRKAEPMTVMERMREIPHKIYGKKKSRNKMRKVPGSLNFRQMPG